MCIYSDICALVIMISVVRGNMFTSVPCRSLSATDTDQ